MPKAKEDIFINLSGIYTNNQTLIYEETDDHIYLLINCSFLHSIYHQTTNKILSARFANGSIYQYRKVPREAVLALYESYNRPKFFSKSIRNKFEFQRKITMASQKEKTSIHIYKKDSIAISARASNEGITKVEYMGKVVKAGIDALDKQEMSDTTIDQPAINVDIFPLIINAVSSSLKKAIRIGLDDFLADPDKMKQALEAWRDKLAAEEEEEEAEEEE
jgi:hypothetical protein